ncbi:hypothetical protein V3C99_002440 [Haemonchus contortus]
MCQDGSIASNAHKSYVPKATTLERCTPQGPEVPPASWKTAVVSMPFVAINPCNGRFPQEQRVRREHDIDLATCKRKEQNAILPTSYFRTVTAIILIRSLTKHALQR